jgi:hypothetical protein
LVLRDGLNFILASTIIHPPQIAYSSVFGSNKWYQRQLLFLILLNQKLENIAMYRYSTKPCILNGVDFQFCKAKMEVYIQAQGYAIWEKAYKPYEVPEDNAVTAANMQQVEANSKARNNIFQGLGRSDFDRVVHLKSAYQVWKAHCDCREGSSTIKEIRQDLYKKDYMCFEMSPGESLDDFFACFNKILSNLRVAGATFTEPENAHQLLGALDMSIWELKVTSI